MAVTSAIKAFQIFSGLSVISITPFVSSFLRGARKIKQFEGHDRKISSDQGEQLVEEKRGNSENAMQEAVQRMGQTEGEKRCFWLFTSKNLLELFMCIDMQTLKSPSLFHYAWRSKDVTLKERLNEINEITYNGTETLKMTFENNKTRDIPQRLLSSFAWYRRGEPNFFPKRHCSIKQIDNSKNYTLSCKPGSKEFTEIVYPELPSN